MEPQAAHQRAQDAFAGVLDNVTPDQLGEPTPCSQWTIRDLIMHVVSGNNIVVRRARVTGESSSETVDPIQAYRVSAADAVAGFATPDAMSATYDLGFGQIPGSVFIGMRTTDVLTHAWDLATATGQSTDLDPEVATEMLAVARERVQPGFRGPGRPFGEEQPCSPERPPADRLAAFLGRSADRPTSGQ
ncbi:MAG: TIGR03086 family protein [Mycobacteriaceae bacterium]|nr:TIGR03086 family protein [Mycobacteriaceae bacterium]